MNARRAAALLFTLFCAVFLASGCKQKTTAASFIGSLDYADSLIKNGDVQEASKLLKKLARYVAQDSQFLSLTRRYIELADYEAADALLQKGLKAHPSSAPLRAVYAQQLLAAGKAAEALPIAAPLEGGPYGSILTETKITLTQNRADFLSPGFVQNYLDAAKATRDSAFLRNAAVILAKNGEYARAAALQPAELVYFEQPLFWSLIMYDAGNFSTALRNLTALDSTKETASLKSDILVLSKEYGQADQVWKGIISQYPDFSPLPYANAALYAKETDNPFARADLLFSLVTRFPDYTDGLIRYAQLALDSSKPPADDDLTAAVRRAGVFSLSMEAQSKLPRVAVADAFKRIDDALTRSHDPFLAVEYLQLKWVLENKTAAERKIDLYLALEADPENQYLIQYAVWFFLLGHDFDAASRVFDVYLAQKYGVDALEKHLTDLNIWESQYAAYLLTIRPAADAAKSFDLARRLYERVLEENPESYTAAMNLADIYNSAGRTDKALELYAAAVQFADGNAQRSETHYRAAAIYAARGDVRNAKISLNYALSLYPGNTKARLLLRKFDS